MTVDSGEKAQSEEWLETLMREGWVVVPQVLSSKDAAHYADRAYRWVEGLGTGYSRTDPSTHTLDKLHYFIRGGLVTRYGVAHEQFVWDIKQEPSIVEKFEKIWGTDQLLVSFDGVNISIPVAGREPDDYVFQPWAHVDQSPNERGLYCVQGILNLVPNGPHDGGLMVLKGSSALYGELFDAFDDVKPERGWNTRDRHDYSPEQLQWLYDHGCEWHKVCARPGDLLLWDSRTVHYGATPEHERDRLAVYCCYKPAKFSTNESWKRRRLAWGGKLNTSHDPISFSTIRRDVPEDHPTFMVEQQRPLQDPLLTPRGKLLAGLIQYDTIH